MSLTLSKPGWGKFTRFVPINAARAENTLAGQAASRRDDRRWRLAGRGLAFHLTPISCYHRAMAKRMPKEVAEYLTKMGQKYGKLRGKKSLETMTAEERSTRAKKASLAAAKKRTAERLERERQAKPAKSAAKPG